MAKQYLVYVKTYGIGQPLGIIDDLKLIEQCGYDGWRRDVLEAAEFERLLWDPYLQNDGVRCHYRGFYLRAFSDGSWYVEDEHAWTIGLGPSSLDNPGNLETAKLRATACVVDFLAFQKRHGMR